MSKSNDVLKRVTKSACVTKEKWKNISYTSLATRYAGKMDEEKETEKERERMIGSLWGWQGMWDFVFINELDRVRSVSVIQNVVCIDRACLRKSQMYSD